MDGCRDEPFPLPICATTPVQPPPLPIHPRILPHDPLALEHPPDRATTMTTMKTIATSILMRTSSNDDKYNDDIDGNDDDVFYDMQSAFIFFHTYANHRCRYAFIAR